MIVGTIGPEKIIMKKDHPGGLPLFIKGRAFGKNQAFGKKGLTIPERFVIIDSAFQDYDLKLAA